MTEQETGLEIAVIGTAGRFPGADDVAAFGEQGRRGSSGIRRFGPPELSEAGVTEQEASGPDHVPYGGVLPDADRFDAEFFGYTPRDAALLDPQQRVFLELAWHALEDAALVPGPSAPTIGVYAGSSLSTYLTRNLLPNQELIRDLGDHELLLANDKDALAARVAYHLDLRGPAVAVQTGCSSSLVAVHQAVQALLAGDCEIALAGGVSLRFPQTAGYRYESGGILSPDGSCRPFDQAANGTVGGNGGGVVVLRPLDAALRAGDPVRAVILASAVTNDGAARVGFTAPGVRGQLAAIRTAHRLAGVDPRTIGYLEAHGTGTALGDPIELTAASEAFRGAGGAGATDRGWCALGSVKARIGHLDAAAGVAGLLQAIAAVRDGVLPPSPYFEEPNPEFDLANSPFYVPVRETDWPEGAKPRRAGVSSFGMGGTNAHVLLEQPPPVPAEPVAGEQDPDRPRVLVLSARTEQSLADARRRLAETLRWDHGPRLADVAHTLASGRRDFEQRAAVVCTDREQAVRELAADTSRLEAIAVERLPVVFLFPGQGAQHAGMAAGLYRDEPVFAERLDACVQAFCTHLDLDLRDLVAAPAGEERDAVLRETRYAQPALFAVQYALAALWDSWGVRPSAMLGHSVGEYVAACLAGTVELADAAALVAARGRLMQAMPRGAMLAVELSDAFRAAELEQLMPDGVELSARNAPELCVLGGQEDRIQQVERLLSERGVGHRRLHTSHAFHTGMMEPARREFAEVVREATLAAPRVPYIANPTGSWIAAEQAADPAYWASQLREPVRFDQGVATVAADGPRVLLEVGPGNTLATLARRNGLGTAEYPVLCSLPHPKHDRAQSVVVREAAARLWTLGVDVDLDVVNGAGRRVSLPGYPFARTRHWIDPPARAESLVRTEPAAAHAAAAAFQRVVGESERLERRIPPTSRRAAQGAAGDGTPEQNAADDGLVGRIAAIWSHLLGIDPIGPHDDFFELGGHSLLATRVLARIGEATGVPLPPDALFASPTVAGLAARVRQLRGSDADSDDLGPDHADLLNELHGLPPEVVAAELERLATETNERSGA